jgi:hypothetical protein
VRSESVIVVIINLSANGECDIGLARISYPLSPSCSVLTPHPLLSTTVAISFHSIIPRCWARITSMSSPKATLYYFHRVVSGSPVDINLYVRQSAIPIKCVTDLSILELKNAGPRTRLNIEIRQNFSNQPQLEKYLFLAAVRGAQIFLD